MDAQLVKIVAKMLDVAISGFRLHDDPRQCLITARTVKPCLKRLGVVALVHVSTIDDRPKSFTEG